MFCFVFLFSFCCWDRVETIWYADGVPLASLASVWLFSPSCMLTWKSSFALAAIILTQLTTPYIRIAPAAGDGQLTGQTSEYSRVILPISHSSSQLCFPLHRLLCLRPASGVPAPGYRPVLILNQYAWLFCVHINTHAFSTTPLHVSIVCLVCRFVPFEPNVIQKWNLLDLK